MNFKIGEIALIHFPGNPYHGSEVEIMTDLKPGMYFKSKHYTNREPAYGVSVRGYKYMNDTWVAEKYLRKKPNRDIDKKVSWKEFKKKTGWLPEKVNE